MTSSAVISHDQAHHQSLADGTAGLALLRIERALSGQAPWTEAHALIRRVAAGPIDGGDHAGLYYGAPAVAFLLHAADTDGRGRYEQALTTLDRHVARLARRRINTARTRINAGEHAQFSEYDLFYGLVGIGALLLSRQPGSDVFGDVLRYLVRLTRPARHDGVELPGWWVTHDPDPTLPTPGGHANLGMAHGAAGILALLALAARAGHTVEGHHEALEQLADWMENWRQQSPEGPWWPQWITLTALRTGRPAQQRPGRPSWCYGTPGIARALQLAALATGDTARRRNAEQALLACLTDQNLTRISDPGICHGMAGLYQTAYRAAGDSTDPALRRRLPALAAALRARARREHTQRLNEGLLTGRAGVALALESARHAAPPRSGWDACLLIT
ncbi:MULTISPECIES: lanthionine synthetase C family protein [Thermomonospora]|uniref:Lanthionine synthetase C family protein n=1 Tax=Thermomonospora curvata (strain ATCC 19995 / DSM 43183 / JCM 3096 / KCTC 9072 / NBRC 15933 / NCIMB 10081 / Henssen B9) TaxID=471852 RepID=D1A671_THECD|nr:MULTISPECIES: lanthionine synthetase C family protein [Thermomonospora]ACZ00170.1 Lanthionine synthetase C family protein [Thermomonospora curvata DSM 43183]